MECKLEMDYLSAYLSFLPSEGQYIIEKIQRYSCEPISILSGIHWVLHYYDVEPKLAKLIIAELNRIIECLGNSEYSLMNVTSVASLTLSPDKCYDECFGTWEDYQQIKSLTPIFEAAMGRPVVLRYPPQAHLTKPALWKKLHQDARLNRVNKNKADGN